MLVRLIDHEAKESTTYGFLESRRCAALRGLLGLRLHLRLHLNRRRWHRSSSCRHGCDHSSSGLGEGRGGDSGGVDFLNVVRGEEAFLSIDSAGPPVIVRLAHDLNDIASFEGEIFITLK